MTEIQRRKEQVLIDRAHVVEREIDTICQSIKTLSGIELAERLYFIEEERAWELLGYEKGKPGYESWLAEEPRGISYSYAKGLSKVYRRVVKERGVDAKQLEGVDLRKVEIALPALGQGKATAEEIVSDAQKMSRSDLIEEYQENGTTPEKRRCPTCQSYVSAEKLEAA